MKKDYGWLRTLNSISFILIASLILVEGSVFPEDLEVFLPAEIESNQLPPSFPEDSGIPTNKRYASMTYSFGGSRGGSRGGYGRRGWGSRNRYGSSRYGGGSSSYYRNQQSWRPWERLPDTMCYRQRCSSSSDCCRRYNKCDRYAQVCHDCWYGYPCKTSDDCCEKYPYCSPRQNMCSN